MGHVTDVSGQDPDDEPVLTETEAGGLFGGRLLADDPLVEYLNGSERPDFVLRNKKRGLRIERDGDVRRIEPHSAYNALCVATDVRLLVVVGQEPRDESVSIPLSEIVSVDVEEGVLGSELIVTTAEDTRYAFPCRGDVESVAAYVDEGTQAWARAYTLMARAEERLDEAIALSDDGEFETAIAAVDEARDTLGGARHRLESFGAGALAAIESELAGLEVRIGERRLMVHQDHGEHALSVARSQWEDRSYDAAYDSYAEAEAAFERAQSIRDDPTTSDRLERVREERSKLEVAPVAYAEAMAAEARETDDPATAAQCWAVALERYRDVYALDWGLQEKRFDVRRDGVRDRILGILSSVIECRLDAARRARETARDRREAGDVAGARDRLETALASLETAIELEAELRQESTAALGEEREAVAAALAELDDAESS